MIHHIKENLLTSDCKVIIHQSNCLGGFGSGIAGQIRYQYPNAYQAFKQDTRLPEDKLGDFSSAYDSDKFIYNLYGQYDFGGKPNVVYTQYDAFEKGLSKIMEDINTTFAITPKIGMPYLIGCGLAGGDWKIVYDIIEDMSTLHNLDIYLYEYTPPTR